jgi:hypothetical protein
LCWRSTADPDELLYWIVDDVARSVAWAWAQRAPSARTMTTGQAQSILAMPLWHNLVNALNIDWGTRESTIAYLKRSPRPAAPAKSCDDTLTMDYHCVASASTENASGAAIGSCSLESGHCRLTASTPTIAIQLPSDRRNHAH